MQVDEEGEVEFKLAEIIRKARTKRHWFTDEQKKSILEYYYTAYKLIQTKFQLSEKKITNITIKRVVRDFKSIPGYELISVRSVKKIILQKLKEEFKKKRGVKVNIAFESEIWGELILAILNPPEVLQIIF